MPFEVFQDPPEFDMRIIPFSHDPWGKKVSQKWLLAASDVGCF